MTPLIDAERRWREWAALVGDGLGRGLDSLVVDLVVTVNLAGFRTRASCQGHSERSSWWWWIDFAWDETDRAALKRSLRLLEADTGIAVAGGKIGGVTVRGERTGPTLRLLPAAAPTGDQWVHQHTPPAEPDRLREWQSDLPVMAKWFGEHPATPVPLPPDSIPLIGQEAGPRTTARA